MKAIKPMVVLFVVTAFVVVMIPAILVLPFSDDPASDELTEQKGQSGAKEKIEKRKGPNVKVSVYRTAQKKTEVLDLEEYVAGVVSAEMPAVFELEALKAQSLAARTYIVSHLSSGSKLGVPDGADVTDTQMHQVYKSPAELKKIWRTDYPKKLNKIKQAVQATSGQILTYKGKPITATFFSTSNGYTENSEDYWSSAFPYLKSVSSPWDKDSPKFYNKTIFTQSEFEAKLGVRLADSSDIGVITARTAGNRVAEVKVGGKKFTGVEIRTSLNLASTDFTWERKGQQIIVSTKGFGHGVGMSQYGANGMAGEGKNYKEILSHYYK